MKLVDMNELIQYIKRARGYAHMIYLHWTAGKYGQYFDDYHINIDQDGRVYIPSENLAVKRNHTWQRNSNAVGIALCACYGAQANDGYNMDMGDYPVTQAQIEAMSYIVALFAKYGGVPIECALTHCEVAYFDGYGPYSGDPETRWDLWYLPDNAQSNKMIGGGDCIRGKARWYIQQN